MLIDRQMLMGEVHALLESLRSGTTRSCAYETAWVARLRRRDNCQALLFPKALDWLRRHQLEDGSWGSAEIEVLPDRMVSTVRAMLTLLELAREHLMDREEASWRISAAQAYIERKAPRLENADGDFVGFELIFPSLLSRASAAGIQLPLANFDWVRNVQQQKLKLIPENAFYDVTYPLVFNLECLGSRLDPQRLRSVQSANGSFGSSPSATAYTLEFEWNDAAVGCLQRAMTVSRDGGMQALHPIELFERTWVLDALHSAGLPVGETLPHLLPLQRAWTPRGIGMSADGIPADLDDSIVSMKLLRHAGISVNTDLLHYYEGPEGYVSYPLERTSSPSLNSNVLITLKADPKTPASQIERLVKFLARSRVEGAFWRDKWHISPYYATARAVSALSGLEEKLCDDALEWLAQTQRANGSWGSFGGSCEETAYALQAIMCLASRGIKHLDPAIDRGVEFLIEHMNEESPPALWISKTLYCPVHIVRSAVLSVLLQYTDRQATRQARCDDRPSRAAAEMRAL